LLVGKRIAQVRIMIGLGADLAFLAVFGRILGWLDNIAGRGLGRVA